MDEMVMMRPSFCCRIPGNTARTALYTPVRLMAMVWSQSAGATAPTERGLVLMPALLTSTSTAPHSASTADAKAATAQRSDTSQARTRT